MATHADATPHARPTPPKKPPVDEDDHDDTEARIPAGEPGGGRFAPGSGPVAKAKHAAKSIAHGAKTVGKMAKRELQIAGPSMLTGATIGHKVAGVEGAAVGAGLGYLHGMGSYAMKHGPEAVVEAIEHGHVRRDASQWLAAAAAYARAGRPSEAARCLMAAGAA